MMQYAKKALQEGWGAVRVIGETDWMHRVPHHMKEELRKYEAKANDAITGSRFLGMCMYNSNDFDPSQLRIVLQTHPYVVFGDGTDLIDNFYFMPPGGLLSLHHLSPSPCI